VSGSTWWWWWVAHLAAGSLPRAVPTPTPYLSRLVDEHVAAVLEEQLDHLVVR